MNDTEKKNYTVPALERGLSILQLFDEDRKVLSTKDLSEHLGLSASALYRIVQTLTDMKYLTKIARNTYELGPAVISAGYCFLASREIVDVAAPHLHQLRSATSVSCHLGIRDGLDTLYIYRALASQRLSVNIPLGTRLPCHGNALGRSLLSGLKAQALEQLYLNVPMDNVPKPQPQSLLELKLRLKEETLQGYAMSRSDFATAMAVPLRNYANEVVAAINLSGPDVYMRGDAAQRQVTRALLQAAADISAELGFRAQKL